MMGNRKVNYMSDAFKNALLGLRESVIEDAGNLDSNEIRKMVTAKYKKKK